MAAGFLRTRVGRRLFGRFLLAAFIPASVTAMLAFAFVRAQVTGDAQQRVLRNAKGAGLNTLAALERLEWIFRSAVNVHAADGMASFAAPQGFAAIESRPIEDGVEVSPGVLRPLTADERGHVENGETLIVLADATPVVNVLMGTLDPASRGTRVIWGSLDSGSLWTTTLQLLEGDGAELCVVESRGDRQLLCDATVPGTVRTQVGDIRAGGRTSLAEWRRDGRTVHTASWAVFLRFEYGTPDWTVLISQTDDAGLVALRGFATTFGGVMLLGLLCVFFLSHTQIRRSTEPLERLQAGTRRVIEGDFDTLVEVSSKDEFADLAASFNRMSQAVRRQLLMLQSMDDFSTSVLGARTVTPVLEAALLEMQTLAPVCEFFASVSAAVGADAVAVSLRDGVLQAEAGRPGDDPYMVLLSQPLPGVTQEHPVASPGVPSPLANHETLLPLRHAGVLFGYIAVTAPAVQPLQGESLESLRRLADRLAQAIADVHHLQHLAALSAGTLMAFARAIDANSPWTAGHSERVTEYALAIGRTLRLGESDMDVLRRGGLLHDIGKIGVPPAVLDKAGPLSPVEREIIERHPVLGEEILEPIGTFEDAIPIVRSHHERMNGTGYPDGLAGDAIPYLARVLAVADVFDALTSERPYRAAMPIERAVGLIRHDIDTHFDPAVTAAFLEAVERGDVADIMSRMAHTKQVAAATAEGRRAVEDAA